MGRYREKFEMILISKKRKKETVYGGGVEVEINSVSSQGFSRFEDDESSQNVKKNQKSGSDLTNHEFEIDNSPVPVKNCSSRQPSSPISASELSEQVLIGFSKKKSAEISSSSVRDCSKMPSAAEIEEFFAAAEKYEQKRFTEKYNYDIVKDVPLQGKYQWVRLQSLH